MQSAEKIVAPAQTQIMNAIRTLEMKLKMATGAVKDELQVMKDAIVYII